MKRLLWAAPLTVVLALAACSRGPASNITQSAEVPDFTLKDLDGKNVSLSDYKNVKPVLLVFWATWCPYCIEEMPRLQELADKNGENLQILLIDIQESAAKVAKFVQARGIKMRVLLDEEGEVSSAYGLVGVPTLVLIGKDGKGIIADNALSERILEEVALAVTPPA